MPVQTNSQQRRKPRINPEAEYNLKNCLANNQLGKETSKVRSTSTSANTINEQVRIDLISRLHADDKGRSTDKPRGTLVSKWLLRVASNSTDALVLSQLVYWLDRGNKPNPKRGLQHKWVAKSATDLAVELVRKKDDVDHSLRRLKQAGLIDWVNRKFGGVRQRHIWIPWANVQKAYMQSTVELPDTAQD